MILNWIYVDVPRRLCGLPDIAGFFRPFLDNSELPPEQQLASFETWVSGYYSHPDVMSRDIKGLTQQLPVNVALGKPPTLSTMTPEDKMAVMDPAPVQGHEMFINSMPHDVYLRGVNRMFEKHAGSVWPRCKVKMIWCEQTLGECVTGAWDLTDLYDEKAKKGEVTRVMITTSLPGANHFVSFYSVNYPEVVYSGDVGVDSLGRARESRVNFRQLFMKILVRCAGNLCLCIGLRMYEI